MARRRLVCLCVALAALALGGCELAYLVGGKGMQPALYKFPKDQKTLVLVEVREGLSAPPSLASDLADSVGKHLWKYHAVETPLVPQDRLIALQAERPDDFKKMGIADIARETGADSVLRVWVTEFSAPTTSDGTVDVGYAEAYVKVVDKKGTNVFGSTAGIKLEAHDTESLVSDRDVPRTVHDLIAQLSTQTGRMFHNYDLEDADMNPARLDPVRQSGHPGQ